LTNSEEKELVDIDMEVLRKAMGNKLKRGTILLKSSETVISKNMNQAVAAMLKKKAPQGDE